MRRTIFYSWQADHPNNLNRGLIEKALNSAVASLPEHGGLAVDSDTRGTPGSPDIANTIFEKIDNCFAFVADVSIINPNELRKSCNNNVLVELGYAAKAVKWDRVILVFNEAFGDPSKDLPFDLGFKRALLYRATPDSSTDERRRVREGLAKRLGSALEVILLAQSDRLASAWLSPIANILIKATIEVDEFETRIGGWPVLAIQLEDWAKRIRYATRGVPSEFSDSTDSLTDLAGYFDDLAFCLDKRQGLGREAPLTKIQDALPNLHLTLVWENGVSEETAAEFRKLLVNVVEDLIDLHARGAKLAETGRFDEVLDGASTIGGQLLEFSLLNLELGDERLRMLRLVAKRLHLLDETRLSMDGGKAIRDVMGSIHDAIASLQAFQQD